MHSRIRTISAAMMAALAGITLLTGCGSNGSGGGSFSPPNLTAGGKMPAGTKICSALSFSNVTWSSALTAADEQAFEAALNVTGSFEGNYGWVNLANNSDGQGMSLGLLGQNLGTGTLQPLLVQMSNQYMNVLQQVFDSTRLQSLLNMLSQWQSVSAQAVIPQAQIFTVMDEPVTDQSISSADAASITWAINNLYSGASFQSDWETELTAMAQTPAYISIQIQAAYNYHAAAVAQEQQLGVDELRTYLMLFDMNVQNGPLTSANIASYDAYVAGNSQSTDTDRLNEVLTLILQRVKTEYIPNVESRKETIINGTGTVDDVARNLPSQYCYNSLWAYH